MGAPCFFHDHQTVDLVGRPAHLSPTLSRRRSSPEDSSTSRSKTRPGLIPARPPLPPPEPLPHPWGPGEGPKGSERGETPKKSKKVTFLGSDPRKVAKTGVYPPTPGEGPFWTLRRVEKCLSDPGKRTFLGSRPQKMGTFGGPDPTFRVQTLLLGSKPLLLAKTGPGGPSRAYFGPSGGSKTTIQDPPLKGENAILQYRKRCFPPFSRGRKWGFPGVPPYPPRAPGEGGEGPGGSKTTLQG